MPDLIDLIGRWWKQMLALIIIAVAVTWIISFLKPVKYMSVATAVPASSFASDKAKIFNDNIQQLYSTLGTPDDLDAVVGIANLDTVYLSVATDLKLAAHYKVKEEGSAAITKATHCLRRNTKVYKSEYGNLKVKVRDADKNMAAQLANAIMDKLSVMYQNIQSETNKQTLEGLIKSKAHLQEIIDSSYESPERAPELRKQLEQYDQKITEYGMMFDNKPPALIVVEPARASAWPDKPKTMILLLSAAIVAFLFSLLLALILDRRKKAMA